MTLTSTDFSKRLAEVRARIKLAAENASRDPHAVRIVAVGKRQPVEAIIAAHAAGQAEFGENYAQELKHKRAELKAHGLTTQFHFIGRLQRNKVRHVIGAVDLIHTVDSPALLEAIAKRSRTHGQRTHLLFQVNLAREPQKAGCSEDDLPNLIRQAATTPEISVDGLMTMPPMGLDHETVRPFFVRLRELRDRLVADPALPTVGGLPELSMGMSDDFEVAVAEGATLVRIGTLLFGPRPT